MLPEDNILFKGIGHEDCRRMISCFNCEIKHFRSGSCIADYSRTSDKIGIVLSGAASMVRYDVNGVRTIAETLGEQSIFGEFFTFSGSHRSSVEIIADSDCQVLFVRREELMKRCDLTIATGGRPMVKAAYSTGVPAYGSGAGNATVIIDNTADTPERQAEAARNTRISKTSDFGSGCSCDGNLVIHESIYDAMVKALIAEGGYLATPEEAEKIKKVMWDETGHRLPGTVAIAPQKLAEAAGFSIPEDRKFIMVTGGGKDQIGKQYFFSSEKLTTLLALFKYEGEFENALDMMRAIFEVGGKGHSCGIYSWDDSHIDRLGMAAPVSRIMVRQPNNKGNAGAPNNGMPPTSSMGCGTWGGNIVSENITLKHYMNTTWVSRTILTDMPPLQDLFGEFYHDGMDEE